MCTKGQKMFNYLILISSTKRTKFYLNSALRLELFRSFFGRYENPIIYFFLQMYDYLFNFDPDKIVFFFRFTDDAFDAEQAATIGVDFKVKTITINGDKVSDSAHIF